MAVSADMNKGARVGMGRRPAGFVLRVFLMSAAICLAGPTGVFPASVPEVELLDHSWHPGEVWEKIGKTQFYWTSRVRNHGPIRLKVSVYYSLRDKNDFPLARNVYSRIVGPGETAEIKADSYIESRLLPRVVRGTAEIRSRRAP